MLDIGKGKHGCFHLRNGQFMPKDEKDGLGLTPEPDIMWPTGTNRVEEHSERSKSRRIYGW